MSQNSSKKTTKTNSNEASWMRAASRNESPIQGVPLCRLRGKGAGVPFPEYFESAGNYLLATFGEAGLFWKSGQHLVIPPVSIEDLSISQPGITERMLLRAFETRLIARDARIESIRREQLKIFGVILQTITPEGLDVVMRRPEWPPLEVSRDPLLLRRLIVATHSVMSDTNTPEIAKQEARDDYYGYRQGQFSSLLKYVQGYKQRVKNMEYCGCTYIPSNTEQAMDFIRGLDDDRYGALKTQLTNEESMRVARGGVLVSAYPNTLETAVSMVSQWVPSNQRNYSKGEGRHLIGNSTSAFNSTTDTTQTKRVCWECGEPGHIKSNCPNRSKSIQETDKKKTSHFASIDECDNFFEETDDAASMIGVIVQGGITKQFLASAKRKQLRLRDNEILLDSGANGIILKNRDLAENIRENDTETHVVGVGGITSCKLIGDLRGFGTALIVPEAPANILPLSLVEDLYQIRYVRGVGYFVKIKEGTEIKFLRNQNGLYSCIFDESIIKCMVTTVSENREIFSARELAKAAQAKKVMEQFGYPSVQTIKEMIKKGVMTNLPITVADIERAEQIYGKDVAIIKGKSTRPNPSPVPKINTVEKDKSEQTFFSDIFHVRKLHFLITVSKPMNLIIVNSLRDRYNGSDLTDAINDHISVVQKYGFEIREIVLDPDPVFTTQQISKILKPIRYVAAGTHVAIAERAIRVIKERHRSMESVMPFKIPRRFLTDQIKGIVSNVNLTPSIGAEDARCAFERLTGIKADFDWLGDLSFGSYCQIPNDANTIGHASSKERTVGAIAMRHLGYGVWKFYTLLTGKFVTRRNWQLLPTPDIVLQRIEELHFSDESIKNAIDHLENKEETITPSLEVSEINNDIDQEKKDDVFAESEKDIGEEDQNEKSWSETEINQSDSEEETTSIKPENLGSEIKNGIRKSTRSKRMPDRYQLHANIKKAIEEHGEEGKASIRAELEQMHIKRVWTYVDPRSLSPDQKKRIIRSMIFLKAKFDSAGAFEKLKARLVAGGNMQDETLYNSVSSPTIPIEVVFIVIAIAASEQRKIRSVDITGAYLECDMPDEVHMSLDPTISSIVGDIDETAKDFTDSKGKIIVKLNKALYGCKQSGLLWYRKLTTFLESIDFIMNPYERCLFNKNVRGYQVTICFHVDDLLITSVCEDAIDEIVTSLSKFFSKVTDKRGPKISYLGMSIDAESNGSIAVSMERYIEECIEMGGQSKIAKSPATEHLFVDKEDDPLNEKEKEMFHSKVAKLLYLAKRVRPDILTAVSYLACRVQAPKYQDLYKLNRVFSYLNATKKYRICFRSEFLKMSTYIDASFAVHEDMKSRSGVVIMIGGGVICAISKKQKLVTKSSTEAELVALSDGSTYLIWFRQLLEKQGYNLETSVIFQDNKSVMEMLKENGTNSLRTRHINIRYYFIRDRIKSNELKLEYLNTQDMIADMMTKPLNGSIFNRLVGRMLDVSSHV